MFHIGKITGFSLIILYLILFSHMETYQPDAVNSIKMKEESNNSNETLNRSEDTRNKESEVLFSKLGSDDSTIRDNAFVDMIADYQTQVDLNREPNVRFKKYLLEEIIERKTKCTLTIIGIALGYFKLTKEEVEQLLTASEQYKPKDYKWCGVSWGEHEMLIHGIAQGGGIDAYEPFIRHFNIDVNSPDSLNRYEKYFLLMNEEGAIKRFLDKLQSPEKRNTIDSSHFLIIDKMIIKKIKKSPDKAIIDFGINYINSLKSMVGDNNTKIYLMDSALYSLSSMGRLNKEFRNLAKPILLNNSNKWSKSIVKNQIEMNLKEMDKSE